MDGMRFGWRPACSCFYCTNDRDHPATHTEWNSATYLGVGSSPMVRTKICNVCWHEEEVS